MDFAGELSITGSTRCNCVQYFTITVVICLTISTEKLCRSKCNEMFKVIRKQFLLWSSSENRVKKYILDINAFPGKKNKVTPPCSCHMSLDMGIVGVVSPSIYTQKHLSVPWRTLHLCKHQGVWHDIWYTGILLLLSQSNQHSQSQLLVHPGWH